MASPVTDSFRRPISPPPPVYLRSSPPPPPSSERFPPVPKSGSTASHSPHQELRRNHLTMPPLHVDRGAYIQSSPLSPVRIDDSVHIPQASSAIIEESVDKRSSSPLLVGPMSNMRISQASKTDRDSRRDFPPRVDSVPPTQDPIAMSTRHTSASTGSWSLVGGNDRDDGSTRESTEKQDATRKEYHVSNSSQGSLDSMAQQMDYQPLQYHHQAFNESAMGRNVAGVAGTYSGSSSAEQLSNTHQLLTPGRASHLGPGIPRPISAYSSTSDLAARGRSPHGSPGVHARHPSVSPDVRPVSAFVDLLNTSYPQPTPSPAGANNDHLRMSLGNNISLLSHKQTFEMYLANVKKTNDAAVQYEFAVFMINAFQEMQDLDAGASSISLDKEKDPGITRSRLLAEAKAILQRLADRSYPFAQYYLGDGYSSGMFSKGKVDYERALPLFVAASKHGHAEASYRAGLCNEFGWGCRPDGPKAAQFYRQAASKNHPGAMLRLARACLAGEMGLGKRDKEGLKWLKRATDSADVQYNGAPYDLGLLHEKGFGDLIFKDEGYAAQLFTRSGELGHADANYRMGEAYEHGLLECPRDPALSIHFYTAAAQSGHALAQMALCAWYMVGAEPVLERDEMEACEWARRAAEQGLAKAQYAVGYFTEVGMGCHRDPLEANVWYVKAADQGDERAIHRLAAIQAASEGADPMRAAAKGRKNKEKRSSDAKEETASKPKRFGIF